MNVKPVSGLITAKAVKNAKTAVKNVYKTLINALNVRKAINLKVLHAFLIVLKIANVISVQLPTNA